MTLHIDESGFTPAETNSKLSLQEETHLALDVMELIFAKIPDATLDDVFGIVNAICLVSVAVGWERVASFVLDNVGE